MTQPDIWLCRDSFVGDAHALVAPKVAPWAAAAGRHQEESASDLEGGDSGYRQEHFPIQPPPPPPKKPAATKEEKKKTAQVCSTQEYIAGALSSCKLCLRLIVIITAS